MSVNYRYYTEKMAAQRVRHTAEKLEELLDIEHECEADRSVVTADHAAYHLGHLTGRHSQAAGTAASITVVR